MWGVVSLESCLPHALNVQISLFHLLPPLPPLLGERIDKERHCQETRSKTLETLGQQVVHPLIDGGPRFPPLTHWGALRRAYTLTPDDAL